MNTRLLMAASACFLGILGLGATFLPAEILDAARDPAAGPAALLLVQLYGALAFGGAMLNWMSRTSILGGIYGRPIVLGNALHFTMGALAIIKGISGSTAGAPLVVVGAGYACFAVLFCLLMFRHPAEPPRSSV